IFSRDWSSDVCSSDLLPREQLSVVITNLQRIRRAAEDTTPPTCLTALKSYQLTHMNAVIDTLIAFVGGADNATLNAGMAKAQESDRKSVVERKADEHG